MIYDTGVTRQPHGRLWLSRAFKRDLMQCKWQLAAVRRYSVGPFAASVMCLAADDAVVTAEFPVGTVFTSTTGCAQRRLLCEISPYLSTLLLIG
ncbi:MAG: hypothetical protein CM15mP68_5220 [Pseudomonadota bacterium]|nr:MAG: hypothetical protein CM15mP68_5220 [Pseudomonadota bacterium]